MEIVLENICKSIGSISLLNNINLKLYSGNIYGFTGENGCGKTVLFKTLIGFMKETKGNIYIDGEKKEGFLSNAGIIIERPNFIPYYTAFRNLKIIASYDNKVDDSRIKEVIRLTGLNPEDKKKIKNFSLGMQQRLAISLALMENPSVLILDEPLNAIDYESVLKIREILKREKEKDKLILVTSHYRDDIESLCDYVYEMKNGEIVMEVKKNE